MIALVAALTLALPPTCGTPDRNRDAAPQNYVFVWREHERIWGLEEPYFTRDVLPFLRNLRRP